jgi:hypothetical protein
MRPLTAAALLLGVLPWQLIAAADLTPRLSITPLVGYRIGGEIEGEDAAEAGSQDVELENASLFGLVIKLPAEKLQSGDCTEWELYVSRQTVGIDRVPDGVDPDLEMDITHVLVGGTYIGPGERVRPFLGAGIGAAHLSPDAGDYESDTVLAFGRGVGLHLFPERRIGGRIETRVLGAVTDSDSDIFCASGQSGSGCLYRGSGNVLWQWELTAGLSVRF